MVIKVEFALESSFVVCEQRVIELYKLVILVEGSCESTMHEAARLRCGEGTFLGQQPMERNNEEHNNNYTVSLPRFVSDFDLSPVDCRRRTMGSIFIVSASLET
jgi:hypothetical protein